MTKTKTKPSLRIDKKVKTTILNYGLIKNQIKSLTKQKDLIKDEILPYFEKTNAIMLVGLEKYEGYAQRVNRQSKRFNLTKFKEQNPKGAVVIMNHNGNAYSAAVVEHLDNFNANNDKSYKIDPTERN